MRNGKIETFVSGQKRNSHYQIGTKMIPESTVFFPEHQSYVARRNGDIDETIAKAKLKVIIFVMKVV